MATLLEKFTAWTGMEPASKSPIAEMIVKSTDPLLMGPDWASNLEVADLVNTYESEGAKEAIKCLRKRLVMERKAQLLALTLLESLMKNCHDSFHVEVASKEFMADLCKVATQRKTDTDVAQQILDLCAGWAAEYGSHPLLGNFARAQANLVAQGVGQHVNFSPLVSAGEGGAAAARPLVASTTSTRGVASHVAEPDSPGQVRLVTAPPAVPTHGGPGMLPPGDAPLAMVADDALPGTMPPPPVAAAIDERAADDEARRRAEADDEEEERLAMEEEENALQVALAESLQAAHVSQAADAPPAAPAPPPPPPAPMPADDLARLKADIGTLQGNIALFADCLGGGDDAGQAELLAELAPGLEEARPRVVALLEGGEVDDEALMAQLLQVHEDLSQALDRYTRRSQGLPDEPPAPAAAAEAAAPAEEQLIAGLAAVDAPAAAGGAPPAPPTTTADELAAVFSAPPAPPPAAPPAAPAPPPGDGDAGMGHLAAPPPGAPGAPPSAMADLASLAPPSMPPPSMPPPSMPPPAMPPPTSPPPAASPAAPAAPAAPVVQILDL